MGKPRDDHVHEHAPEIPWMKWPLVILAIGTFFSSWFLFRDLIADAAPAAAQPPSQPQSEVGLGFSLRGSVRCDKRRDQEYGDAAAFPRCLHDSLASFRLSTLPGGPTEVRTNRVVHSVELRGGTLGRVGDETHPDGEGEARQESGNHLV